jgi:hypothetical protein
VSSTWRERFAPVISKIIREHQGQPMNVTRKALRDWWGNSGMGPREYHPYKIFLDEIRRQLGTKKPAKKLVIGGDRSTPMFTEEE